MTPAQQAALESVASRPLTPAEYMDIDALLPTRNDVAIAAIINAGQAPILRSLRVEEVFDIVFSTGDYLALKAAQLQGNELAVMAFSVLSDAKTIGSGLVNLQLQTTVDLFDQMQAVGLLSGASRSAFADCASVRPEAIHYNTVSDALNVAEGRMTL